MIQTRLEVDQVELKRALSAQENAVRRERDGEASTKLPSSFGVGLVEAARTWGGQLCVRSRAKLSRYPLLWVVDSTASGGQTPIHVPRRNLAKRWTRS